MFYGVARTSVYAYNPLQIESDDISLPNVIVSSLPATAVAGTSATLVVVPQDVYLNQYSHGGENFAVTDTILGSRQILSMFDRANGTYSLDISFTVATEHYLHVLLGYPERRIVTFQPIKVVVSAQSVPSARNSYALGAGTTGGIVNSLLDLDLFLRDAFGNDMPSSTSVSLVVLVQYASGGSLTP